MCTPFFVLTLLIQAPATGASSSSLDTAAISRAIGRTGQMQGIVYRISLPRTDLDVRVNGVKLRAGFALGSWVAFRSTGSDAIVDGDLVLLEREVDQAISRLFGGGLDITALHNHILNETPRVMYLHIWGRGDAAHLAAGIRSALEATATPLGEAPAAPPSEDPGFDAAVIQQRLGVKGAVRGGVLSVSVPRPEKITVMGAEMPPRWGWRPASISRARGTGTLPRPAISCSRPTR